MKQKVLFTASTYSHIENFHLPYLREFQRLGWEVHIGCGNAPEQVPYTDKIFNLPFQKSMGSVDNFRAARQIRRMVQSEGYNLILTHTSLAAFFTRLAVKGIKCRPRLVNVVHGYLFDDDTPAVKRNLLLNAERFTAQETDLLLTMNVYDYELAKKYQLGKEIGIIPGIGVDFARLDEDREKDTNVSREGLGIQENSFVLIYPAEFSKRKSQNVLIRAMTYLPDNVVLILCGDGAEMDNCKALAKSLELDKCVLFPGRVAGMSSWYRVADAAVTASRSEGLPFNVMEAMYCGLPVVASSVKGHIDLLDDGVTGLLYPYGDAKGCAEQIRCLFADSELRSSMGARAADSVVRFGLNKALPVVLACYGAA